MQTTISAAARGKLPAASGFVCLLSLSKESSFQRIQPHEAAGVAAKFLPTAFVDGFGSANDYQHQQSFLVFSPRRGGSLIL